MNDGSGSQFRRESEGHDIGPDEDRGHLQPTPVQVISHYHENEGGEMEVEYVQENVFRDSNGIFREPLDETPVTPRLSNSSRPRSSHRRRLYEEIKRLETFRDWYPGYPVRPADLARDGFYYIGPGDRVKCVFCLNILRSWEEGDSVEDEHRTHYPKCPFVLGQCDDLNIPINPHDRSSLERRTKAMGLKLKGTMEEKSARLNTFDHRWPSSCPVTPSSLAEAGFYFKGMADIVVCFKCNIVISSWEIGDDPWTEHAKHSPCCPYLLCVKGSDFVKKVLGGKSGAFTNHQMKEPVQVSEASSKEVCGASETEKVTEAQIEEDMKSPVVQAIKDVIDDADIEEIRRRIKEIRLQRGPSYKIRSKDLMDSTKEDK